MLQVNLQMRQNRSNDLREVIMNLAPAYEQWYAKTIAEGEVLTPDWRREMDLSPPPINSTSELWSINA